MWRESGHIVPAIDGCQDVDLAVTPATNTLPIKRLRLPVGGSASLVAAWVKFPEFQIQPLSQRNTRLGPSTYRYESDTGFRADIEVDDLGLVIVYPGSWERVGAR